MKICTKCGRSFPETVQYFHRHPKPPGLKPRCKSCHREDARAHYARRDDKGVVIERSRQWAKANPEKVKQIVAKSNKRVRATPSGRMALSAGRLIAMDLSARGYRRPADRQWFGDITPWSIVELVAHLERLFKPGMSWANYGQWQLDHIRPRSGFSYSSPDSTEFLACWSLQNIQPLWAWENMRKGAKWAC